MGEMDVMCRVQAIQTLQMKVYVWCCRLLTGGLLLCFILFLLQKNNKVQERSLLYCFQSTVDERKQNREHEIYVHIDEGEPAPVTSTKKRPCNRIMGSIM